jgi:hypothetical protein
VTTSSDGERRTTTAAGEGAADPRLLDDCGLRWARQGAALAEDGEDEAELFLCAPLTEEAKRGRRSWSSGGGCGWRGKAEVDGGGGRRPATASGGGGRRRPEGLGTARETRDLGFQMQGPDRRRFRSIGGFLQNYMCKAGPTSFSGRRE